MSTGFIILLIIIIAFSATLFRSTFGFGEALIAVPLLSLFLPMGTAVTLAVMMSILVALVVVIHDHSKIHFHSAKWLLLSAILGIPIGLFILSQGNELLIKIILGLVIILYSIYSLMGKNTFKLEKDSNLWLFICGFFSGVLGGAYGANGPPLVIYGNLRQWDAQYFRATLQAYFLPAGLLSIIGYASEGFIDRATMLHFAYCIPAIVPAIFIGRYLNKKIKDQSFYKYVYCGLILIGLVMILDSLF